MYGKKIKEKRQALGLSQEDLAQKLDLTRQAISKWEMDKAQPTMTNLRQLARVSDVDMAYFIGHGEEENKESAQGLGLWRKFVDFLVWMIYCLIGLVFFFFYYYLFMEDYLKKNPWDMPWLVLTIYMMVALISFPQANKYVGDRLADLDYNSFRLLGLPLTYLCGPVILVYHLLKKQD